jgi:mono/diheme cytochrome c family protein
LAAVVLLGFRGGIGVFRTHFKEPPIEIFPDMDRQPKFKAQSASAFFPDGRADRPPVPDTIPYERFMRKALPASDSYYTSGMIGGFFGNGFPIDISFELLERGHGRFEINCIPCHGRLGDGVGVVSKYGFAGIANYHEDRIRQIPDGQIFYTIGVGKGLMTGLPHIPIEDRWAIVAYVRALQRSRNSPLGDAPPETIDKLLAEPEAPKP